MKIFYYSVFLCLILSACASDDLSNPYGEKLQLPIRIHLPHSSESADLNTNLTEAEISEFISFSNSVWSDANIEWVIEEIVIDSVSSTASIAYNNAVQNFDPQTYGVALRDVVNEGNSLHSQGWDIFFIPFYRLTTDGGDYFLDSHTTVVGLQSFTLNRDIAHYLGRSLSLDLSTATNNLMIKDGSASDIWLNSVQILEARKQAEEGHGI